jgi:hypothetical protein
MRLNIGTSNWMLLGKCSFEKWHKKKKLAFCCKSKYILAYLLHARTVEPQKQPSVRNTRTQQCNNGIMQSVSGKRLGKHFRVSDHAMQGGDVINSTVCIFLGACAECL